LVRERQVIFVAEPSKRGALVGVAVVVAVTAAVAADEAVSEPAELLAVTETLTVDPTSADPRRSVVPVVPESGTQEPPPESQRCHR
jgi:hypothetical protein